MKPSAWGLQFDLGWYDCDLAVSKAFSELTIEYRFLISILSGEVFMDAGTDFGTQKDVPGKPGLLLDKDGSGVSLGTGDRHHTGGSDLVWKWRARTSPPLALQFGSGLEVLVTSWPQDYSAAWTWRQRHRAPASASQWG